MLNLENVNKNSKVDIFDKYTVVEKKNTNEFKVERIKKIIMIHPLGKKKIYYVNYLENIYRYLLCIWGSFIIIPLSSFLYLYGTQIV